MKKLLAVLVATAMIGIVAIPVLASPFSDLPEESHWALDAVRMLAALGIIEGYPDGTYKGKQPATRYEVALIVARALEYLDRDIRDMSERMAELEGKLDSGLAQPDMKQGEEPEPVLQPPASPDATILEQVIYEKIAAMSDEQWTDFEEKLYELVARVDDLSEENKAEHAKLWEAIEEIKAAENTVVVDSDGNDLTQLFAEQKVEREREIEELEAKWQLALDEQNAALTMAFYDSLRAAAEGDDQSLEGLAGQWQLALDERNAELTMAFYDSLRAAQDDHTRDLEALEAEWQLALDEQNAELMMAFYDSLRAAQDDHTRDLEALEAEWQLALDEQNAALTMAFYDSVQAQKDDIIRMIEDVEARNELAIDELRAELSMENRDSVFAASDDCLREVNAVVATIEALQTEYSREIAALNLRVDALEKELAVVRGMADQNAKDIAETYHKIKTEDIAPLEERVGKLESKTVEHDEKIAGIWDDLNRVRFSGSDEVKFTDIDLYGPAADQGHYKDPWNPAGKVYERTSTLQNKLQLELNIVPEKGVNLDVGLSAVTDIFGKDDTEVGLFNGDLNLDVTTPNGKAKMLAGDLARPRNFTKYQISRKVFADAHVEGLSLDLTTGPFVTTGMIAKIEPKVDEMQYVLGGGASYTLGNLTVGGRLLKITDDEESAVNAETTPNESVAGAGFALKLGEGWTVDGEISSFAKESVVAKARNVSTGGKLGVFNISAYLEQVDEGYAPKYLGTASNDADKVAADTRKAGFEIETDPINGLTLNGGIGRKGDAWYDSKDTLTYAGGAKYDTKLGPVGVTLRGDVAQDHVAKPSADAGIGTTTELGFDVAWKPLEAGFTWEHEVEAKNTSYVGYANLDMPLAADTLKLKGNWKQSFGSKEYYTYGVGLGMNMPLVEDVASLGADVSYGKSHGMAKDKDNFAKFFVGGGLDWKLRPATTLSGNASYEARDYEKDEQPSGEYLQYGLALSHEIYKSTTLKMNYDFKDVYYSPRNQLEDYSARIIGLSLKTVF